MLLAPVLSVYATLAHHGYRRILYPAKLPPFRMGWSGSMSELYWYQWLKTNMTLNLSLCLCSAVHPKAGGGATAGAWTDMASRCQALTAGSVGRCSATTWRANEKMVERPSGWRKDDKEYRGGWGRKKKWENELTLLLHVVLCKHLKGLQTFDFRSWVGGGDQLGLLSFSPSQLGNLL